MGMNLQVGLGQQHDLVDAVILSSNQLPVGFRRQTRSLL